MDETEVCFDARIVNSRTGSEAAKSFSRMARYLQKDGRSNYLHLEVNNSICHILFVYCPLFERRKNDDCFGDKAISAKPPYQSCKFNVSWKIKKNCH